MIVTTRSFDAEHDQIDDYDSELKDLMMAIAKVVNGKDTFVVISALSALMALGMGTMPWPSNERKNLAEQIGDQLVRATKMHIDRNDVRH